MQWFFCDATTGQIVTGGIATADDVYKMAQAPAPAGQTFQVTPDGAVSSPYSEAPDFTVLKQLLSAKIDDGAGALRAKFITDVPGQAQTYERKEREARAWTVGANEADFPFLATEAAVREVDIGVVRAEVMAQVNALTPMAALIEAHRMCAKTKIAAAETLPAIIAASTVDWASVLGG